MIRSREQNTTIVRDKSSATHQPVELQLQQMSRVKKDENSINVNGPKEHKKYSAIQRLRFHWKNNPYTIRFAKVLFFIFAKFVYLRYTIIAMSVAERTSKLISFTQSRRERQRETKGPNANFMEAPKSSSE